MRGTPIMLQILFVYYALPIITDGAVQMDDATAAVRIRINYAAYLCEIFCGGIQSISWSVRGAKVLGFTYAQTMRKIILPQMFKRVLPPLANETINLLERYFSLIRIGYNDILAYYEIYRTTYLTSLPSWGSFVLSCLYLYFDKYLQLLLERRFVVYED